MKQLFLIFLGLVGLLCAQTKLIFLDTLNNQYISSVIIKNNNEIIGISSNNGEYFLNKKFTNDTLEFSHISYIPQKVYLKNQKISIIYLTPKTIITNDIVVTDKRISHSTPHLNIKIDEFNKITNTNVADIFKNHTSFFIKDYGQGMAVKTISARGMSSENTLVLFNEARINDLRTGCFDFNSININTIENIDVFMGSDDDNLFSSVGGVVKITTGNFKQNKTYTNYKFTNDNMHSFIFGHSNNKNAIKYSFNLERAFSPNKYTYEFENKIYKRANAQFNKSFFNFDLMYTQNSFSSKLYAHYSYFKTGIPGAVVSNYDGGTNIKNVTNSVVVINNNNIQFENNFNYFNTFAFNYNKFTILDPNKKLYFPFNKRVSELIEFQSTNRINKKFDNLNFNLSNFTMLSHLNDLSNINLLLAKAPKYKRILTKTSISFDYKYDYNLLLFYSPSFNAAYYITYLNEDLEKFSSEKISSYKFGLTLPILVKNLNITSNYAHDVREPSYSERFYSTIDRFSNKNLKNEDYYFYDISASYSNDYFIPFNLRVTYFNINANNKIVWVPIARMPGLQIPVNEGKVKSTGYEIFSNLDIKELYSSFSFNYIYNKAINKNRFSNNDNSYNKILIYAPVNKLSLNHTLEVKNIKATTTYSFIGKRYYTADNTPRNKLPKYQLIDFTLLYQNNIDIVKYSIGFSILNLTNEKYFVIQSYPMPLRNYLLFINMEV